MTTAAAPAAFFAGMTFAQLGACIAFVEGRPAGKPNTKAAGVARLLKGMAANGRDAEAVLIGAGMAALAAEWAFLSGAAPAEAGRVAPAAEDMPEPPEEFFGSPAEVADYDARLRRQMIEEGLDPDAEPSDLDDLGDVPPGIGVTVNAAPAIDARAARDAALAAEVAASIEAARAAALAAAPAEPKSRKPRAASTATAPKEGTGLRTVFDMMMRDGGATNAEICAAVGYVCSFAIDGRRFADRFGLLFETVREGRNVRFQLTRPSLSAE